MSSDRIRLEAPTPLLTEDAPFDFTALLASRRSIRRLQDGPFTLETRQRIEDAVRYTPAGGYVQVTSWLGEGERPGQGSPGRVTIAVRDTGAGIAREHWAHLFERFYRVDRSRTRDTGGTGLGLAIVRELVEAQGGRVWLNSQPGKGTIFFVTLPRA